MNAIIVPTDFSKHAENAGRYAWQLAKCINSRIILCNAFNVPAQEVMAAQVAWPLEDYKSMQKASTSRLKSLAERLEKQADGNDGNTPLVSSENQAGSVADVVGACRKGACCIGSYGDIQKRGISAFFVGKQT